MMLQVKKCNKISLLLGRVGVGLLLLGAVSSAFAGTSCGTNLEYEIEDGVLTFYSPDPTSSAAISSQAFKDNTDITDIIFPDNLTDISTSAFQGCTALTSIVIPPMVTNIGVSAFYGCSSLANVLCLSPSAPSLGTDAFSSCADGLIICVPNLGSYRNKDVNWKSYYDATMLEDCFLNENDEQLVTETKIEDFREASKTDVHIFRTLRKAGCFNTLTLPFNVPNIASSPLEGAEVYVFNSAAVVNGVLHLTITPLSGSSLTAGIPYLIQWPNTGEILTYMHFTGISWDNDQTADDAGIGDVTFHGFYGKTHIDDETDEEQHLNLFLGANNQLYWPSDGATASAKMLGFRAYFEIEPAETPEPASAPVYRGMPAVLRIVNTPTDIKTVEENSSLQGGDGGRLIISEGHLIIIRNGGQYAITGQKL